MIVKLSNRTHAMSRRVAVVTGSNKGIGFHIVKGLVERFDGAVYLTARDDARGRAALDLLRRQGLRPEYHQLDVSDENGVLAFRDHIKEKYGGIDILVNNAAILDPPDPSYEDCKRVLDINYYSLVRTQELLFPLMREGGRVLNISSDCGHLSNVRNAHWIERLSRASLSASDVEEFVQWYLRGVRSGTFDRAELADGGTVAAYRVSKVAVSALSAVQARALAARGVAVNSLHPGLVRTDMTRGAGFYSPEQAAAAPLRLLLDAPHHLTGAYVWYDGSVRDWSDHTADYYFKYDTLLK